MPDPLFYLKAMGAAAIVSALCVLATAGVRRPASRARLNSACVLGMGLGLAAGYCVLSWQWTWPPVHGLDRFFMIVVPTVLGLELFAGFQSVPRWVAWSLRLSLAALISRILLHDSVYLSGFGSDGTALQTGTGLALCGALLTGAWGLLAWLYLRSPGVSIPLALCLTTQSVGLTVMLAGYIKGGASAFPWAAALMATTIGSWLIGRRSSVPAIIGIGVVGLFGLLFIGRFFGRLSNVNAMTLFAAPLLCWVTEIPQLRKQKPWLVGSVRLVLVAIPLVLVLARAKRDFDRDMAPLLGIVQVIPVHLFREL